MFDRGKLLVQPATGKPILYTENVYVRFKPNVDPDHCEQLLRDAGLMSNEYSTSHLTPISQKRLKGQANKSSVLQKNLFKTPM